MFLRTEEKKREALRSKEVKNSPTPTLLDVVANPIEGPAQPVTVEVKGPDAAETTAEPPPVPATDRPEETPASTTETPDKAEQDILRPSIEV